MLLLSVVLFTIGAEIRVRIEDSLLASCFGDRFRDYQRTVPVYIRGITNGVAPGAVHIVFTIICIRRCRGCFRMKLIVRSQSLRIETPCDSSRLVGNMEVIRLARVTLMTRRAVYRY
jgi:hypothetical protein